MRIERVEMDEIQDQKYRVEPRKINVVLEIQQIIELTFHILSFNQQHLPSTHYMSCTVLVASDKIKMGEQKQIKHSSSGCFYSKTADKQDKNTVCYVTLMF